MLQLLRARPRPLTTAVMGDRKYDEAEIERHLSEGLEGWGFTDGHLIREFRTGDWRRGSLLAGAIAFLGEAAFHHPDIVLGFPALTVRLRSHDVDGITDRDFELARRIEEVATWRPTAGDGPPDDWIT